MQNLLFLSFFFVAINVFSQVPQGISFQGVARDVSGNILVNKQINVKITIHPNNVSNPAELSEIYAPTTNNYGVFSIVIGQGIPQEGSLSLVQLDLAHTYYVVQLLVHDGTQYQPIGMATPFQSVPYALVAKTATDNMDKDSTNELQDLHFDDASNIITITKNGNATAIDLSKFIDSDNDSINEIQTVSLKNNNLHLSKSNSVNLGGLTFDSLFVKNSNSANNAILGQVKDSLYLLKLGNDTLFTIIRNSNNMSKIKIKGIGDEWENAAVLDLQNGSKKIWRAVHKTDGTFEIAETDTSDWANYTARIKLHSFDKTEINSDLNIQGITTAKGFADKNGLITAIPAGCIMPFAGSQNAVPQGWLLCDGKEISKSEYNRLFQIIGNNWGSSSDSLLFKLPDLRGLFLRGADLQSGIDPHASARIGGASDGVGSYQKDAFGLHNHGGGIHSHIAAIDQSGTHTHTATASTVSDHFHSLSVISDPVPYDPIEITKEQTTLTTEVAEKEITSTTEIKESIARKTGLAGSHTHTVALSDSGEHIHNVTVKESETIISAQGDQETRPVNAAVHYIIKY